MSGFSTTILRPYQLMCAICSIGDDESRAKDEISESILALVRKEPDMPISLQCNAGDVFEYQDIGTEHDTKESMEFNVARDLEILYRINLFPGAVQPARIIFSRILEKIETV